MFDKNKFALVLKNINDTYDSQRDFAHKSEINRTYLSQYMNMKIDKPPLPKILEKIAEASKGITTYNELMTLCGYREETIESVVYDIYKNLTRLSKKMYRKNNDDLFDVVSAIESFQEYVPDLIESIELKKITKIYLVDYYRKDFFLEDFCLVCSFLFLYESFLKCLEKENFINITNYKYSNYFDTEELYQNLSWLETLELLSFNSSCIKINFENSNSLLVYIKDFLKSLNLAHLSDYDSNVLTEIFKSKVNLLKSPQIEDNNSSKDDNIYQCAKNKYYSIPVYGQISAGLPNWAEECLEGYLPVDPNMMNIINPEECFFLRINGESMNKVIRNGAYALIRKQDIVENGEIAAVLVNGDSATIKKFTQHGDVIVLEPMSDNPNYQTQIYDKDTSIKILGKYIGKFEINN